MKLVNNQLVGHFQKYQILVCLLRNLPQISVPREGIYEANAINAFQIGLITQLIFVYNA